jgi:diguanylate cyclase (GGDEF)-like protein
MEYLKNISFFSNLSEDKLKEIASICKEVSYPQGTIIFRENDPGDAFYLIKKGKVKVYKDLKDGITSTIAVLGEGDFFGEMALIEESFRSATVEVLEDCQLIMIERENFQNLLKMDNSISLEVMKILGKRLRKMDERTITAEEDSIIDGVTGLYTHKYLKNYLNKELIRSFEHEETFSLIMIDIDNFKNINDQYGHPAGDYILKGISELIKRNVHSGADVVARYGGEEIAIVLPETPKEYGILVAKRLRHLIENFSFSFNNINIEVTISLGVSNYPEDGETVEELINLADEALYRAKKAGKNKVFWA